MPDYRADAPEGSGAAMNPEVSSRKSLWHNFSGTITSFSMAIAADVALGEGVTIQHRDLFYLYGCRV
jgi:hypothetical protein